MTFGASSPEIQDKLDQLFSDILVEQSRINSIRKADPEKAALQKKRLDEFAQSRGRGFIYPYLSTGRGHGPFTELVDGSVKYDLIGAMGVNLLGHSHPLYIKSHLETACSDTVMCGNLLPYEQSEQLTKTIVSKVSNSRLKHFWFAGSGSFANDNALKMIWQKSSGKHRILAFEKAFAGRSIAMHDVTFNEAYREGMPRKVDVDYVPHFNPKDPSGSYEKTISALEKHWSDNNGDYCALMLELVQGEGGINVGVKEYYQNVLSWAKDKGLFIWIDEVQTFARTRELFAFQYFELDSLVDIVTVGKVLQCCGTLYTDELNPKPGLIAGTFNGSLASLSAGHKIIQYLCDGPFYGNDGRIAQIETTFKSRLAVLESKLGKDKIDGIAGLGTMIAFQVGDGSKETTSKILTALFENGIIAFSAGKNPSKIRFLLPLSITDEHIDEVFEILEKTLTETLGA